MKNRKRKRHRFRPVINPSFEEGTKGWKLKGKAKVERGFGTVASGGLLLERSNPEEYQLSSQSLRLKPGRIYNFSIMIRSEDVKGGDRRGGTFAVEFSDKNGKWIRGGAYPNGASRHSRLDPDRDKSSESP